MRWKIEDKSKRCLILTASSCIFSILKQSWNYVGRNILFQNILVLFPCCFPPPTILHLSDVWRGGRGNFSRTFNIFFFIHCTGVCLYRILIAQKKKQFPVFAVKITFLMKKFLRQNKFRVVFSVASEHYFLMFYHSINNPESRQQSKLTSQNLDLLPG